jgi:hypothetical protein
LFNKKKPVPIIYLPPRDTGKQVEEKESFSLIVNSNFAERIWKKGLK